MKKIFSGLLALSLAALLSAQDVTFGVGARGSFGLGFGSMLTGNIVGKMVLGEMAKEGK